MKPEGGRTYSDVTKPLRLLTTKHSKFVWSKACEESFQELKDLLCSDTVMASYDPAWRTRLYVDEGPTGVAATVAQEYKAEEVPGVEVDHSIWRSVCYKSRAKIDYELNYGKVDGESLAILSGVLPNKMYLYGPSFEVVTDHLPLVSLYNSHSKSLPARVAKHKSKLRGFDFKVVYEPGCTTPSDFPSRNHAPARQYSREEREELGVEDEEDDAEIIVNRVEALTDAVTLPILKNYSEEDPLVKQLMEDVKKGKEKCEEPGFKECYSELSVVDGILVRGERIVIPVKLRLAVLEVAHEGCPGREAMLRQLRLDTWWPGQSKDVRDYVDSCDFCAAAVEKNYPAPMTERETPDAPWQHCSADFKGPVGGQYYFYVLIDTAGGLK